MLSSNHEYGELQREFLRCFRARDRKNSPWIHERKILNQCQRFGEHFSKNSPDLIICMRCNADISKNSTAGFLVSGFKKWRHIYSQILYHCPYWFRVERSTALRQPLVLDLRDGIDLGAASFLDFIGTTTVFIALTIAFFAISIDRMIEEGSCDCYNWFDQNGHGFKTKRPFA